MIGAARQPQQVWNDQSYKADHAAKYHASAHTQRRANDDDAFGALDIYTGKCRFLLAEQEKAQARLDELQALFAAADDEDFEDADDTGVLPGDEVKAKKAELKTQNAEWKQALKIIKALAADLFAELKAADKLPAGAKKGHYCTEGLTAKDPAFANGHRIIALAEEQGHASERIAPLREAIETGQRAHETARRHEADLERHQALEDEAKTLKATLKSIEARRDEQVAVYSVLAAMGLLSVSHLKLDVQAYDPAPYAAAARRAPVRPTEGGKLDRILKYRPGD